MKLNYLDGTKYSIEQKEGMFHFGSDTELLGKFMRTGRYDDLLDIGTNNGALLCYGAEKQAKSLYGIDLFEEVIAVAKSNMQRCNIEAQFSVCNVKDFKHDPFSVIVCNPPYFATKNEDLKNESSFIRAARHEEYLSLDDLFSSVQRLLKQNGRFYMVYRPSRIHEVFRIAERYGLYAYEMRIAYQSQKKRAKTVLFAFSKNPARELEVLPPVFLNERDSFKRERI